MIENYSSAQKTRANNQGCLKKIKNIFLSIFFFVGVYNCTACICPELPALSRSAVNRYDAVFVGEVMDVSSCTDDYVKIKFHSLEIFLGEYFEEQVVLMDCSTSCLLAFEKGEQWLMFVRKNNAQELIVEVCSHSRKFPLEGQKDYEEEVRGTSVFQDVSFLKDHFPLVEEQSGGLKAKKYEKVNPQLIPIFLGVSVLFLIFGLWVFKKVSK